MSIAFDPSPTGDVERHPQDGWTLADPYPMSPFTLAAVHALIRALTPPPPAPQLPDLEDRIATQLRTMLPYMSPAVVRGFIVAVHALNWSPLWTLRGLRPLQMRSRDEGRNLLHALAERHNPILDNLLKIARSALLPIYYDQDEVHEALGYDVRPFMQERIALRKRILDGQDTTPQDMIGPYSEAVTP